MQLIFFNMLLAIINNAYTVVHDDKESITLYERTKLYAEFAPIL